MGQQQMAAAQGGKEAAVEPGNMLWLIQRDFLEGKTVGQMVAEALQPVDNPANDPDIDQVTPLPSPQLAGALSLYTGACYINYSMMVALCSCLVWHRPQIAMGRFARQAMRKQAPSRLNASLSLMQLIYRIVIGARNP